jgi:hypothetical protein
MRAVMRLVVVLVLAAASSSRAIAQQAAAPPMPADYQDVLTTLKRSGDFKDAVLKVNIPRSDLRVTIRGRALPTAFGFGGWVAMTKSPDGAEVMMGDLVVTEDEVNPVMSALLDNGLDVTALHNHFFWEQPRVFYMHVHGHGRAADLAAKLTPAIAIIDAAIAKAPSPAPPPTQSPTLDTAALSRIIGAAGDQNGVVYKITIGRPDLSITMHGAAINARMGLNTWAAFTGTNDDALVAGDIAMTDAEVTPVLKALRANGIEVVAIHHHMTDIRPAVTFLHYFGSGPAQKLAEGVRRAIDQTARGNR